MNLRELENYIASSNDVKTNNLKEQEADFFKNKGNSVDIVDYARSKGLNDVANKHINYLNDMSSVSSDSWVNVNIHDPNRMDIFYDRYAKFSDSTFDRLGFSPFRNNDAYYNENTTTWENHQRVLNTMPGMVWNMMKQTWFIGDENTLAKEYEKMNSMAYDTRESGSWYNNMILSSSATVGIMASILVEQAVGLGLSAFTGGGSEAIAATGVARGAKLIKNILSGKKFADIARGVDDVYRVANATERIAKGSRIGEYFKDFATNLNPLKNTTEFIGDLKKGAIPTGQRFKRGFAGAWADGRTMNLVYKESALEANLAKNEFIDNEINKFRDENGRMPDATEVEDIKRRASSVRSSVLMGNLAAIYLTDKIMFNDLLDPVMTRTLRKGATGLPRNVLIDKNGYFVSTWKDWIPGKHFKAKLKKASGDLFDFSMSSVSEGLQENIQDVLADAAKSYYADAFNTDYGKNSFGEYINFMFNNDYMPQAIRNQISEQGLETFLTGALMGGPIAAVRKVAVETGNQIYKGIEYRNVNKLQKKAEDAKTQYGENSQQYKDANSAYETAKNQYAERFKYAKENDVVDKLNALRNDPKAMAKLIQGMKLNEVAANMFQGLQKNSVKESESDHDFALEQAFSYAMMFGQIDNIIDHYNELKSEAGALYGQYGAENEAEFMENVDNAIKKANKMAAVWENFDKQYPSKFHPENYRFGTQEYENELTGLMAERFVKQAAVFANEDFERLVKYEQETLADLNEAFSMIGLDDKSTFHSDARILLSEKDVESEIKRVSELLGGYDMLGDNITPDNKKRKKSAEAKLKALQTIDKALKSKGVISDVFAKLEQLDKEYKENQKQLKAKQKQLDDAKAKNDKETIKSLNDEIAKIKKDIASYGNNVKKHNQVINELYGISKKDLEAARHNAREKKKLQETIRNKRDEMFKSSVREYFKWLSDEYGVDIRKLDTKAEGTVFDRLMKLYQNKERMNRYQQLLYRFVEGDSYNAAVESVHNDLNEIHKNFFDIVLESVRTFDKNKSTNQLLNDLFDAGYWVDPASLERLIKTGEMPILFYVNEFKNGAQYDRNKGLPLIKGSEDYNKALKIIMEYCDKNNIQLKNASILEGDFRVKSISLKSEKDNRSYYDLCEFLGIDPNSVESTMSAKDVLEKIANDNEFNITAQREFAKNILDYINSHNIDVEFKFVFGQSEPVKIDGNTISVDLRYASTDFYENKHEDDGVPTNGFSLDFLALKGVFTIVAEDALDNDAQFKSKITEMMNETNEYIERHAEEEYNAPVEKVKQLFEGLDNEEDFVINAMLNPRFQELLQKVQTPNTAKYQPLRSEKSVWERFIEAVIATIGGLMKMNIQVGTPSMLNNSIDLITAKLEGSPLSPIQNTIQPTTSSQTTTPTTQPPTSTGSPLKQLLPRTEPDTIVGKPNIKQLSEPGNEMLKRDLINKFKELYRTSYNVNVSDDEILNSSLFYGCYNDTSNTYYGDFDQIVKKYKPKKTNENSSTTNNNASIDKLNVPGVNILKNNGIKIINRLPNGHVKGGQSGWKLRFIVSNDQGKPWTLDEFRNNPEEYYRRANELLQWLKSYFNNGTDWIEVHPNGNGEAHYHLKDENGKEYEPFKFLSGGEIGESDFTIYIGSKEDVDKFIEDVKSSGIYSKLASGNTNPSDISFDEKIHGRVEGGDIGFRGYMLPEGLEKLLPFGTVVYEDNDYSIEISENNNIPEFIIHDKRENKNYDYHILWPGNKANGWFVDNNIRTKIAENIFGGYITGIEELPPIQKSLEQKLNETFDSLSPDERINVVDMLNSDEFNNTVSASEIMNLDLSDINKVMNSFIDVTLNSSQFGEGDKMKIAAVINKCKDPNFRDSKLLLEVLTAIFDTAYKSQQDTDAFKELCRYFCYRMTKDDWDDFVAYVDNNTNDPDVEENIYNSVTSQINFPNFADDLLNDSRTADELLDDLIKDRCEY